MRVRVILAVLASLVIALLMGGGCTEPPLGWPGAGRIQPLPPPAGDAAGADGGLMGLPALCAPAGVMCRTNHDCCSSVCDGLMPGGGLDAGVGSCLQSDGGNPIGSGTPYCIPPGVICATSGDCCANPIGSNEPGYCGPAGCGNTPSGNCVPTFIRCTNTTDCCFPYVDAGPEGGDAAGTQMCINTGSSGSVCGALAPGVPDPLCVPYGLFCHNDSDCCVGLCSENAMSPGQRVCDIPP